MIPSPCPREREIVTRLASLEIERADLTRELHELRMVRFDIHPGDMVEAVWRGMPITGRVELVETAVNARPVVTVLPLEKDGKTFGRFTRSCFKWTKIKPKAAE